MTNGKPSQPVFINEGMHRYRLLALPDGELAGKLFNEKKQFVREYLQQGEASLPSVTVTEFSARDEMEETIIRWLQRILGEQRSFGITLNNYSGCPDHTVFLRIQDHGPFHELAVQLKPIAEYVSSYDCPPVKFVKQPNLPIGENLDGVLYERVIGEYSRRDFHGSFEVKELMLVRATAGGREQDRRAVLRLLPSLAGHQTS
ncbi:MAG: hypothetical protein EOO05_06050 [Chitinophagaceae bacterium]|nr:MAG: hypothetical protein EOO05_06050 [Chitinophagaceae bacterium]